MLFPYFFNNSGRLRLNEVKLSFLGNMTYFAFVLLCNQLINRKGLNGEEDTRSCH